MECCRRENQGVDSIECLDFMSEGLVFNLTHSRLQQELVLRTLLELMNRINHEAALLVSRQDDQQDQEQKIVKATQRS